MKIMKDLEYCFKRAKEGKFNYVAVLISMEGFPKLETIINPYDNFDAKLEYYKKAYNDDLTLKAFGGIKIVDFAYAICYDDFEEEFYNLKNM